MSPGLSEIKKRRKKKEKKKKKKEDRKIPNANPSYVKYRVEIVT